MPPAHRVTTAHLGAAYPFMAASGPRCEAALIGRNVLGGAFCYDPFELYRQGELSSPNMVVLGRIGRGKSAFVKSYLWRQAVLDRRAWVIDPKGEYDQLATAWGTAPVRLRPGGPVRVNPLEIGSSQATSARGQSALANEDRASMTLLTSLAEAALGRPLIPRERSAVELALASARQRCGAHDCPTLPAVVDALFDPSPQAAGAVRTDVVTLANDGRDVALELRRLVWGDLRGMFDGPTSRGLRVDAPLVVVDLSAVYSSPALGLIMTCVAAWLTSSLRQAGGQQCFLVVDEAWAVLSNAAIARWLQACWKLSRAWGVANLAVVHRLSDLEAAGAAGSVQVSLAQGLLADSETAVVFAQPNGEADACKAALGLSDTEGALLPQLGRGMALWRVGSQSYLVEHHLTMLERQLADTDARMERPSAG